MQPFEVAQGGRDSPLHILRIAIPIAGSDEHRIEHLRLPIAGELLLFILKARPQGSAGLKIRAGSVGAEHRVSLWLFDHPRASGAPQSAPDTICNQTQNSTDSRVGIEIAAKCWAASSMFWEVKSSTTVSRIWRSCSPLEPWRSRLIASSRVIIRKKSVV